MSEGPALKIAVVGTGYVGLVTGACLASLGHSVAAFDNNPDKRAMLNAGTVPIFEPGLAELVADGLATGGLSFPETADDAIADADAVFLAVGTPLDDAGRADLTAVYAAAATVAQLATRHTLLICKSTVPVGTNRAISAWLAADYPDAPVSVASNPEFLREGNAIADFLYPDRLVFGAEDPEDHATLRAIYAPIVAAGIPVLETDLETAELVKYAANAFLATKITFINEVADLCERVGANVADVARGIGMDKRIGPDFLKPGPGYGGSCFPKDAVALLNTADDAKIELRVLNAVVSANTARKSGMTQRIAAILGGSLAGKRVAVLGVAFKANTDDMREAPALAILPALQAAGAAVTAHDPKAMVEAARLMPTIGWSASPYAAARHADVVVVLTEWEAYRTLDLARLRAAVASPVIVDLRNALDAAEVTAAGFAYHGIGRGQREGRAGSAARHRARRHAAT